VGELLEVVEERTTDARVLTVDGEIDLGTAATLEEAMTAAIDHAGNTIVVVDLSRVGFLSSVGITALLKARQYGEERGIAVRLVVPEGATMRRSLEVTGLLGILPIYLTLEDALNG
jgi:anti-sigma B factor antagonist